MKFGKKLLANATPEWQPKFIDYKLLKKKVKRVKERIEQNVEIRPSNIDGKDFIRISMDKMPQMEDINEISVVVTNTNRFFNAEVQQLLKHCLQESREMFDALEAEIDKISRFYDMKQIEFKGTHQKLLRQIEAKEQMEKTGNKTGSAQVKLLERAFQEHYRSLVLLENYRSWNFWGCSKILKKFSKCAKVNVQESITELIRNEDFYSSPLLGEMMDETVTAFMGVIGGSHKRAMAMLRIPSESGVAGPRANSLILRCGFLFGASLLLSGICFYLYLRDYMIAADNEKDDLTKLMFRMIFFPVMLSVFLAANVRVWTESNINYVFIFEMDARRHLTIWQFTEIAFLAYFLWVSFLTLYMFLLNTLTMFDNPWVIPLTLLILYMAFILFPAPILYASARIFLLRIMLKSIAAPFVPVQFHDFWFVNQLTSCSDVLFDMQIIYCMHNPDNACDYLNYYFIYLLMLVPIWLRLMQCLRRFYDSRDRMQILNAVKYIITIVAMLFTFILKQIMLQNSIMFDKVSAWVLVFWFGILIINTMYKYSWDIIKDWGLLRVLGVKHFLLRQTLMQKVLWYYMAMILNLLVRSLWLIIFLLRYNISSSWWNSQFMFFILMIAELLRRFVWNIFRLENEHLHNADNFRVVSEIPLPFPVDVEANEREDNENRQKILHKIKEKLTGFSGPIGNIFCKVYRYVEHNTSEVEDNEIVLERERDIKKEIKQMREQVNLLTTKPQSVKNLSISDKSSRSLREIRSKSMPQELYIIDGM